MSLTEPPLKDCPIRCSPILELIDGIINNAGVIQPFSRLNDLDYPTIERVLNVNLLGTLYVTKAFLPQLLKRPEAHIVNLSSMGGFVPVPGQTIYCAKAAVKLLSEGLASELLDTKVGVTVVFPGAIATNIRENSGVSIPNTAARSGGMKPLSAANAAQVIVRGIERDAYHVFVGKDAAIMDKLQRLQPCLRSTSHCEQDAFAAFALIASLGRYRNSM